MLSSEHSLEPGSRQYNWLATDLSYADSLANRTRTPWVIVTSHRMLYTTQLCEEGDYNTSLHLRSQLDPLLRARRVNLLLAAHQHSYERTCPVYGGRCLPPSSHGTVHVTAGTGGAAVERCGFDPKKGNFSVVRANKWGYLRIAAAATTLDVEFVDNSGQGIAWDQTTIRPWPRHSRSDVDL
jgi:hypothetical protein